MPAFQTEIQVRFADCDPAGIVFYPRYFEMFNAIVEDWCEQGWSLAFSELIAARGWGLPTVKLETEFLAPSRLGERLQASLLVTRLGGASITIALELRGPDDSLRVRSRQVLVLTERARGRAMAIPDELRSRIATYGADAPH